MMRLLLRVVLAAAAVIVYVISGPWAMLNYLRSREKS
jgi:hypothetical protein